MKQQSLILICLMMVTFGCESSGADVLSPKVILPDSDAITEIIQENESTNSIPVQTKEEVDLKEFWENKITPIINNVALETNGIFRFPLEGDWGYMVELNKPDSLWTKKDFIDNYDKLFTDEIREKLRSQQHQDVAIFKNNKGFTELLVSVDLGKIVDDYKVESAIIFRFRKTDGEWVMCVIQGVG